jgi:EAL domain-containing protein (putative c-di-GMP-specific phosphodiesterase class I)
LRCLRRARAATGSGAARQRQRQERCVTGRSGRSDPGELRPFVQPKLALDNDRIGGAEAQFRRMHPTRGVVAPMASIPFAEQTGFMRATTWFFDETAHQWLASQAEGPSLIPSAKPFHARPAGR